MAFISLVERQHLSPKRVPGQYRWTPACVEWVYLKTERLTAKSRVRFHAEREKAITKGEDVLVIVSLLKPGDKRHGINRQLRRHRERLARRLMPALRRQLQRDQARMERVLGDEFTKQRRRKKAEPKEERTEGGVILPPGVKAKARAPRKTRKRGSVA